MNRTDRDPAVISIGPPRFYLGGPPAGELRAAIYPSERQMSRTARDELAQAIAEIAANDPHSGRAPKTAAAPEKVDHWAAALEALTEALSTGTPARDETTRPPRSPVIRQTRGGYAR